MIRSKIIYVCENLIDQNSLIIQFLKCNYPGSLIVIDDITQTSQYLNNEFDGCFIFNMSIQSLESKETWINSNINGHCKIFISEMLNIENMQDTILNKFDYIFINESEAGIIDALAKFVIDHSFRKLF